MTEIDDGALSDERVEHPGEPSKHAGLIDDLPDEQAVVGRDEQALGPVHAECAAQPPVRRMQTVTVLVVDLDKSS